MKHQGLLRLFTSWKTFEHREKIWLINLFLSLLLMLGQDLDLVTEAYIYLVLPGLNQGDQEMNLAYQGLFSVAGRDH